VTPLRPDEEPGALTRPVPPGTPGTDADAAARERFWLGAATGATVACALVLVALAASLAPELRATLSAGAPLPRATRFAIHPVSAWSAPFVCLLGLLRTLSLPPGRRRLALVLGVAGLVTLVTLLTVFAYRV